MRGLEHTKKQNGWTTLVLLSSFFTTALFLWLLIEFAPLDPGSCIFLASSHSFLLSLTILSDPRWIKKSSQGRVTRGEAKLVMAPEVRV